MKGCQDQERKINESIASSVPPPASFSRFFIANGVQVDGMANVNISDLSRILFSYGPETVEQVKDAGKPFVFVLTQAKHQASITAQAVAALSQHGRVAQAFVVDRVAYAAAMTGGNTAPEVAAKGHAAEEITALWQEVKSLFHENMPVRKTRKKAHG